MPSTLIDLSQLLLQFDLAFVEEHVGAQVVLFLLLHMLLILFNVVVHADLWSAVNTDLDIALIAANVLYLQLEGPIMVLRIDFDSVGAHDAKLYGVHELWRYLLCVLPSRD